jgi:hypothetical protein
MMLQVFLNHFICYIPCRPSTMPYRPEMFSPIPFLKYMILTYYSFQDTNILCITYLDDKFSASFFNIPFYYRITDKDKSCERSEPRLILVVGQARWIGTWTAVENIILPALSREELAECGERQRVRKSWLRRVHPGAGARITAEWSKFEPSVPLGSLKPDDKRNGGLGSTWSPP